jgi:hypothetical protein
MAKKLLGDRTVGDVEYRGSTVMTDDEATATGLPATDFADIKSPAAAAQAKPTPEAKPDAGAMIDAAATGKKNGTEQSASSGTDTGNQGGASADAAQTKEHVLTEQDFTEHPELKDKGLKVGDTVRIPA